MAKSNHSQGQRSNNELRHIVLQYFYDRNRNATSLRGKRGAAVKISDVKKELKGNHGLTQQDVMSNLTYLLSQGWVEEDTIEKSFTAPGGTVVPSSTSFYKITAAGIDKIEGPGEFTMPRFHGINIQATGQNIITLGDGNQITADFGDLGQALLELGDAIAQSATPEADKLNLIADVETIQAQLAKPQPNRKVLSAAWETLRAAATINGCTALVERVSTLIMPLIA